MPLPRLSRPLSLVKRLPRPQRRLLSSSSRLSAKWGIFSDLHFQPDDLDRIVSTADWISSTFRDASVSQIVCLGDILNTREHVNVQALSACVGFIKQLKEIAPVHIVLGNHDMNLRHSGRVSALDVLDTGTDCLVYRDFTRTAIDGEQCLMIPWQENHELVIERLKDLEAEEKERTLMFGHLAVSGAVQQAAVSERYKARQHSGVLKGRSLMGFKGVFLGHFHVHQQLGDNKAWYVGAPMQHHFGDAGDVDRGVVLLDPSAEKEENMFEFVRNPKADVFRTVSLQQLKNDEASAFEVEGKRISLKCNAVDLPEFEAWRDKLVKAGAGDVRQRLQIGTEAAIATGGEEATVEEGTASKAQAEEEEKYQAPTVDTFIDSLPSFLSNVDPAVVPLEEHQLYINAVAKLMRDSDTSNPLQPTSSASHLPVFHATIRQIKIENFFSVQGALTIPFHKLQPGTWFIVGANGAGKSLLLEAVVWCLFGRTLRSDMLATDPVNDVVKKNCAVRIDFENGYSIERLRNYPSRGSKGPALKLYKDGKEVEGFERGEVSKTQAALERDILGCDFSLLTKSVVFGDDGRGAANFLTLDKAERREVLEDLLGVGRLEGYHATVRAERKRVEKERLEVKVRMDTTKDDTLKLEVEKSRLEQSISPLELRKQNAERELLALREEEERFETEKDSIEKQRDEMQKYQKVHERLAQLEEIEKRIARIEQEKQEAERLLPVQQELKDLLKERQMAMSQLVEVESEMRSAVKYDSEIDKAISSLERNMDKGVCPTCKQDLVDRSAVEAHVESQRTRKVDVQAQISTLLVDAADLQQKIKDLDSKKQNLLQNAGVTELYLTTTAFESLNNYENKLRALSSSLVGKQSELTAFASGSDIETIKSQYTPSAVSASLRQSEKLLRLYQSLASRRNSLTATRTSAELDLSRITTQIDTITATLSNLSSSLERLSTSHSELSSQLRILLFWETAFSAKPSTSTAPNLRHYLIATSIPLLNTLITTHLRRLSPSLPLSFTPDLSLSPPISKRSSGQRKRNNLAVLFALFQLARYRSRFRADFVMLDEVFDALDKEGQETASEMIEDVEGVRNVFVVSHADRVQGGGQVGMGGRKVLTVTMTSQGTKFEGPEGVVTWTPPEGEVDLRDSDLAMNLAEELGEKKVRRGRVIKTESEETQGEPEVDGGVKQKRKRRTKKEMQEAAAEAEKRLAEGGGIGEVEPKRKRAGRKKRVETEEILTDEQQL